jgi:hypothetical protein
MTDEAVPKHDVEERYEGASKITETLRGVLKEKVIHKF